jgi:hypothetical protein
MGHVGQQLAGALVAAPRVLRAPDDPGRLGFWGLVALVLLLGLVVTHVRLLRAVARARREASSPAPVEPAGPSTPRW